jgi:PAS domain S-box-containing protein
MVTMLNEVLVAANAFISICYFTIGSLILLPFLKGEFKTSLVLATILVFFSCAFGHGGHALLMLNSEQAHGSPLLLQMQVVFDLATAAIAATYIALRRSYSFLVDGPLLLTQTQNQLAQANIKLSQLNNQLESLVDERTIELSKANEKLATEIAERKQTEIGLKANEERFRLLIEGVKDYAFIVLTPDGHVGSWNSGAERIKGYLAEEIIGQPFSCFYRHEDIEQGKPEENLQLAAAQGRYEDKGWRVRKNGALFWANTVLTALRDEAGQLYGFAQVTQDVTEHQQAEEALQSQTNLLQLVLERMSDGVILADDQGQFLVFNPAAKHLFGSGATDTSSSEWSQQYGLFLPDQITPFPVDQLPLVRAMQGEEVHNIKMFVRHAQAPEGLWVMINGTSLKDASGTFTGGVIVCRDVTELKHSEDALRQSEAELRHQTQELEKALQELQQAQSQLVQSEKMSSLGQLVAGVAHEINNPVNFIYGNLTHANEYIQDLLGVVKLYQQHYPNPPLAIEENAEEIDLEFLVQDLPKLLSSMRVGAERIQNIVLALRNFSRMDEAEVKEVDIHEGIDSTLMILQNRLKLRSDRPVIQVIKDYGSLPLVECYAGQLNQVFMNILTNAIDALEERDQARTLPESKQNPSQIQISTAMSDSGWVQIRIADNGPGMSQEVQQRLFNPFFTTKPIGKGTGMGMSISYQIITEKHGGSLQCCSASGVGTEFVIRIPLRQGA